MPLSHSNENIGRGPDLSDICTICNENIAPETIFLTTCGHGFHSNCITTWLGANQTCPLCRKQLDKNSLAQPFQFNRETEGATGTIPKNTLQGAVTRARSVQLDWEGTEPVQPTNVSRGRGRGANFSGLRSQRVDDKQVKAIVEKALSEFQTKTNQQMRDLVEESLERAFRNFNSANSNRDNGEDLNQLFDLGNEYNTTNRPRRSFIQVDSRPSSAIDNPGYEQNNIYPDQNARRANNHYSPSTESVSKIILNWKLTFDGSSDSIPVGEFIYRVNSLTQSTLRGDFRALCKSAHVLFVGRANSWFWRYHHTVNELDWYDICDDLRRNFKEHKSDYEIKETIRSRKQRNGETFDKYLDDIMKITDKLLSPLSERELVEMVIRNLRPDIRLELLHLNIESIVDLKRCCRRRENFFSDIQGSSQNNRPIFTNRRHISELGVEDVDEEDPQVSAIRFQESKGRNCWNCEGEGHNYKQCTKPRRVFCYGCGLVAFFLPNCPNCNSQENRQRDTRNTVMCPKPNQFGQQ